MTGEAGSLPFWQEIERKLNRANIPSLDGLRAIAVFLVIFYHFGLPSPGGLGVLAFFVLSGFLITWLLLKENEKYGRVSLRKFYARRTLRIFPAFYCYWIGMVVLLAITGRHIAWPHAMSAFFYVSNYYDAILGDPNTFVSHTWSLGIEEQFYLLWPIVFLRLRGDLARLAKFLAGVIVMIWIYRLILELGLGVWQGYMYSAFDARADHLLVGCLLAVLLKMRFGTNLWAALSGNRLFPAITLFALGSSSFIELAWGGTRYRNTLGFIINPLLVAILIVQLIQLSSTRAWRFIDWGWVRYLGRISYSLYLYQQVTVGIGKKLAPASLPVLQLVGAVAVTVLFASGSYFLVERIFLKLKDRLQPLKTVPQVPHG